MSEQKFQIGDEVVITRGCCKGVTGRINDIWSSNSRKVYEVLLCNEVDKVWCWSYELKFKDMHAPAEHCKKTAPDDNNYCQKLADRRCQYCHEPFDDDMTKESTEEPGTCEWCVKYRKRMPKIHNRKSIAVDLKDFSIFGKDGDWLEVTEWTNGEGIDIDIHYASDHTEDIRHFQLSYDELGIIMNIVNKFGVLPTIYTDTEE